MTANRPAAATYKTDGTILSLLGEWNLPGLGEAKTISIESSAEPIQTVDGSQLAELDTSGAAVLIALLRRSKSNIDKVQFENFAENFRRIINLALERSSENFKPLNAPASRSLLVRISDPLVFIWKSTISHFEFLGESLTAFAIAIRHPSRFRISDLTIQIERAGLRAIPIVSLVTFLIGLVVAYLFSNQAEKFGASIFVVDAIGMGMCRELAPVLTAIIVAGRSGSAFAAQIGSMKIADEVDAIRVMGLSPMQVLVIPRVLALILAMPFLVFIGDVLGILGGFVIANAYLQIPTGTFFDRLQNVLALRHVWVGLGKAPLFAVIVALIGCRQGLTVEDNARSVGLHTTATVVQSIVAVIILDALLAVLFQELGW